MTNPTSGWQTNKRTTTHTKPLTSPTTDRHKKSADPFGVTRRVISYVLSLPLLLSSPRVQKPCLSEGGARSGKCGAGLVGDPLQYSGLPNESARKTIFSKNQNGHETAPKQRRTPPTTATRFPETCHKIAKTATAAAPRAPPILAPGVCPVATFILLWKLSCCPGLARALHQGLVFKTKKKTNLVLLPRVSRFFCDGDLVVLCCQVFKTSFGWFFW